MPRRLAFLFALGSLVLSVAPLSAQRRGDVEPARHGWLSSLEAGQAQARQSGKPLMVVLRCVP